VYCVPTFVSIILSHTYLFSCTGRGCAGTCVRCCGLKGT
jgi:hypothetical protein